MKAVCLAALLVAPHFAYLPQAFANPGGIYRCGNEYLNDAAQAEARGCRVVEAGGVTVTVTGTRVLSRPAEPDPAQASTPAQTPTQAPTQARAASAASSSSSASVNVPPKATTWRTDSADQRARDRDALSILQAELGKAEALLAERQRELADPQRHASRLGDLQSSIARHLSDVAGLKREISRLPVR